jgi:cell division protein FtsB
MQMNLPFHLSQRRTLYVLGFFILSLCVLTAVGERGVLHLWRLNGEKAKLDEENYRLQRENETLRQRISKLRNDNSYLEKLAREELSLVRPGEIIYRFPPAENRKNRESGVSDSSEWRPSTAQKPRR